MPFQISELVIRVTGDAPEGAVAKQPDPGTTCRHGGTTCMADTPTECRKGGTTCMSPDSPTECRKGGTTCMPPKKSQASDAEFDRVLQQIRDAAATESVEDEALITA
jgi:hypothetical protein